MAIYRLEFDDRGEPLFVEDGDSAPSEQQDELQDSIYLGPFESEDPLERLRQAGW